MFDAGAAAFVRSQPDVLRSRPELNGWYVCPLCLHAFPPEALSSEPPRLTVDEAPPKASARGPITKVLTCRACNNRAGGQLEGELKKRRVVEDFAAGQLKEPTPVDFEAGDGTRVRAEVVFDDGALRVMGVPRATDPKDLEAHWSWWDKQVDEQIPDAQFSVHLPAYDRVRSQLALFKAAYLVAFATFGYRYIFRSDLDPVRKAIRNPDGGHIRRLPVLVVPDQDPSVHRIATATRPLRSLLVGIGREFVFLPWLDSPLDFWKQTGGLVAAGTETVTIDAMGDWPRIPEYRLDQSVEARNS